MDIFLSFAPFIVFAVIDNLAGSILGLAAGAIVSAILLIRNRLKAKSSLKILEIGSFLLFGGLALYSLAASTHWSVLGVRLAVDSGLFLIVLLSIVLRRPFTMQYARERVKPEFWTLPAFVRANYVLTSGWAVAFAIIVAADAIMLFEPGVPLWIGIAVTIGALLGAIKFTSWYPKRLRAAQTRAEAQ